MMCKRESVQPCYCLANENSMARLGGFSCSSDSLKSQIQIAKKKYFFDLKNKTHKKLTPKFCCGIKHVSRGSRPSRPTRGMANGAVTPVREDRQAAVVPNAPSRSRKAYARGGREAFLNRSDNKRAGPFGRGPAKGGKQLSES